MNSLCYFLPFFAFFFLFADAASPMVKSVMMYSGEAVIQVNELHAYFVDLTCFVDLKGDLVVNVDLPNFQNTISGAYLFVSKGPATGKYAPYPDPKDPSTYQWTTENGTGSPLPKFVISNAGGQTFFASINCPNGIDCIYTLVTEYDPVSSKKIPRTAHSNGPKYSGPIKKNPPVKESLFKDRVTDIKMKPLFFSNKMEMDGLVDYNNWTQYKIPLCASALVAEYGNHSICLLFTVVGTAPDYILYQQVSLDPTPSQNVPKWNTRDNDVDPYYDYSGRGRLPVNRWLSTPISAKDVPTYLYHSIVGQGGQGLDPPYTNKFVVFYETVGNCNS